MPHKDEKLLELERSIEKMQRETELTFSVMKDKKKNQDLWMLFVGIIFCAISMCFLKQSLDSLLCIICALLSISGGVIGGKFKKYRISDVFLLAGYITVIVVVALSFDLILKNILLCIIFMIVYVWGTILLWIYKYSVKQRSEK